MPQIAPTTPSTPLTALARRWWIAALLLVVGAGAGLGVAARTPSTYTGEARVAVGSQSLDARVVAGYTTAAIQLASDIARYVNDQQALAGLDDTLGVDAADVSLVSASPIASSSVIRIEVQASSEDAAVKGAQAVADKLTNDVNAVTGESADSLLQQYTDLSNKVATAAQAAEDASGALASAIAGERPQVEIDAARTGAEQTKANLAVLQVQQTTLATRYRNAVTNTPAASGLRVVLPGELESTDSSSRAQRNGLAGAVAGLLVALVLAVYLDRRDVKRARSAGDPPTTDSPTTGSPDVDTPTTTDIPITDTSAPRTVDLAEHSGSRQERDVEFRGSRP